MTTRGQNPPPYADLSLEDQVHSTYTSVHRLRVLLPEDTPDHTRLKEIAREIIEIGKRQEPKQN